MSATALRTHRSGALTRAEVGKSVRLGGWVHRRRDLGGLVFIDLRDRAGLVQLSCNPAWTPPDVMERAAGLGAETVVLVKGIVQLRPEPARDQNLTSREVEVHVTGLEVVGPANSVANAMKLIGEKGCDVALLDVNLGSETAEPVALELRSRGTPFAVLSGYSSAQHPPGFLGAPMLSKPARPEELVAMLLKCIALAR